MAAQTDRMLELNPLGNKLISSPGLLVLFKLIATAVGCGLLYRFRTNIYARRAAWWLCLILTLLTFRWLIFNSMNIS